jgi:ribonuclease P protein component
LTVDRQTFSRPQRLRRSEDISLVLKAGHRLRGDPVTLTFLCREGEGPVRAGFIVRRKLGPAVCRNLMKRRMREAYRRARSSGHPPCDLVFSAQRTADYREVSQAISGLLVKVRERSDG